MGFLPNLGLAAVLLVGGLQVIDGQRQPRPSHRLLRLCGAALRTGALARDVAEHGPARRRLGQPDVRDPRPRAVDGEPAGRATAAGGPRAGLAAAGDAALRRRRACADRASTWRSSPGRTVALVGPTASGKTSLVGLLARLYDPSEGRVVIDGADISEVDLAVAALARSPSSRTTASCSPTPSPATSPTRGRRRRRSRSRPRRGRRRRTTSSASFPTATRP